MQRLESYVPPSPSHMLGGQSIVANPRGKPIIAGPMSRGRAPSKAPESSLPSDASSAAAEDAIEPYVVGIMEKLNHTNEALEGLVKRSVRALRHGSASHRDATRTLPSPRERTPPRPTRPIQPATEPTAIRGPRLLTGVNETNT